MAAPAANGSSPSAFKLQHSSPLDSLVRRTSARRAKALVSPTSDPQTLSDQSQHHYTQPSYTQSEAYDYNPQVSTPPRPTHQRHNNQLSPSSPLLHSRFARTSTATASTNDNNSYLDSTRASVTSRDEYQELEYRYYDDESVYSDVPSPALRDSWQSGATAQPARQGDAMRDETRTNTFPPESPISPVPMVVVSSPVPDVGTAYSAHAGKAPITARVTANFSRPVRSPITSPAVPSEEQKRLVLERNARRAQSPNHSQHSPLSGSQDPRGRNQQPIPYVASSLSASSSRTASPSSTMRSGARSPNSTWVPSPQSSSHPNNLLPPSRSPAMSSAPSLSPLSISKTSPDSVSLPRHPPSPRATSPVSLYSRYSFYQLDSATTSPTGETSNFPSVTGPKRSQQQPGARGASPSPIPPTLATPTHTPQEYLQLGIQHHEANRLKESAVCFEKSAKEGGGCGVGMLMWGLAQRHGWGCEKNEKSGFKWLRKAAESAVEDLESAREGGGMDASAVQTELVLAIYEVGQCFFQGWGVTKDQKMAVSYYSVAARLGDPDAQHDLAFCLANGKGCKKDRKEAAKWYRAAVAQGASDIGLGWIYKEKYQ